MKIKELNKFRTKKVEEMISETDKMKKTILNLQIGLKAGKANKLKEVRNLKRDIAQILTIITEKELQDSLIITEKELQDSLLGVKKTEKAENVEKVVKKASIKKEDKTK